MTQDITCFKTLCRYNRWMNEKLYMVCEGIPDTVRKQDMGAFFRSMHGTLNHLLLTDKMWLGRFKQQPFAAQSLDQELYSDFNTLWQERRQTDAAIAAWLQPLTEQDLAGDLTFTSLVNPTEQVLPLWICLLHLFNHQTHHRGQLTTLLNQSGYDSGVTDLLAMYMEQK